MCHSHFHVNSSKCTEKPYTGHCNVLEYMKLIQFNCSKWFSETFHIQSFSFAKWNCNIPKPFSMSEISYKQLFMHSFNCLYVCVPFEKWARCMYVTNIKLFRFIFSPFWNLWLSGMEWWPTNGNKRGLLANVMKFLLKLILVQAETHIYIHPKKEYVNTTNRQENSTLFGFFIMKMTLHRWIKVYFHLASLTFVSFISVYGDKRKTCQTNTTFVSRWWSRKYH